MDKKFTVVSSDILITNTIIARDETYYLVTEDTLDSLKHKSLLSDLFVFIASLAWGAYFSVIITIQSNLSNFAPGKPSRAILEPLHTIETVFLCSGLLFTGLFIVMFVISLGQLKKIKRGRLDIKQDNSSIE